MPKKGYTESQFRKDLQDLNKLINSFNSSVGKKSRRKSSRKQSGGKKAEGERRFIVVEVNGKKVKPFGRYSSKPTKMNPASPGQAAKRAYKQICLKHKLKGTKCNVTFSVRETTRGSSKKVYGPYKGSMKKLKKPRVFERDGKKITSRFEAIVKSVKTKNKK
tara:strand:+ start:110 stop:595 length:486 start_codon:yes stop_codon:yes gene_type:complete